MLKPQEQEPLLLNNRYKIEETLGRGGAGVVYRAFDVISRRPVAVKCLDTSSAGPDQAVARLQREALLLSRLAHANIVSFHDLGQVDGQPFLVMEYIVGCTLRALLETCRAPLPIDIACHIISEVLAALQAAHQAGVIHRDLKPENIMLVGVEPDSRPDPATFRPQVKVMDFGLAYLSGDARITSENLVAGTALYLAPEAVLGQPVGAQADLYAAGVILYELVAGRPPFLGSDPLVVVSQHLHASPISPRWHNASLPSGLATITLKLLAKNPIDRYPSVEAVLTDLQAVQQVGDEEERPLTRASLLEAIARGRLVGRENEIASLHQAIESMLGGQGQVIFIEGEAGIGKSRLVREASVYARLKGVQVFTGHCYDADLALPYQPFIEIVKSYVQANIKPGSKGHLPAGLAAELVRLAPALETRLGVAPTPAAVSPAEARLLLFEAVAALLTGGPAPVLLILENMHWANPPDLALLLHLAQTGARHSPLLLIITYRGGQQPPAAADTLHKTLTELERTGLATQIQLRPLSPQGVAELLETLLEGEISPNFCRAIFEVTDGSPFFVEEILKALIEEGRIFRDPDLGRWEGVNLGRLEIPASLKEVINRRFEKLSQTHRQVLELAALLGRHFNLEALLAAARGQVDEGDVLDALAEAVGMQLIRRQQSSAGSDAMEVYAFEHALIRQTLSESLAPGQRLKLHRQIGQALETLNQGRSRPLVPPDELAYHFSMAGSPDTEKAISYSLIAVDSALHVYASEVAAKHYQMILDLLDSHDIARRVWILEQLGDLYFHRTRQMVDAVAAYEWAIQLWQTAPEPDPPALIRLYRKMGEIARYWQGSVEQVDTYLVDALQLLERDPTQSESLERARVLAAMAFNLHARGSSESAGESALSFARTAARLATRLDAVDEESMALDAMQRIYRKQGNLAKAHEIDRRRLNLIPRMNNLTEAVDANLGASQMGWETGDLAAAAKFCLEALTLAKRTDNVGGQWEALRRLVMIHLQWGQLPAATTYAKQGVALGPRAGLLEFGEPVEALFRAHLAILQTLQGETEAAARELAELSALYPTTEAPPYRFALGWLNYENEIWPEAEQNLESGHAFPPPFLPDRFDLVLLVEIYAHLGNEAAFNQVRPAAETEVARRESPYLLAILNRGYGAFYASQSAWTEAEAAFKRALAVTHRKSFWYQDARTWLDYGRMLVRRGQPGDLDMARDCLEEAKNMFLNFGALALAEKAWLEATRLSQ